MSTVFFDIDTQLDFLYPAGSLYVPGAEQIVPAVAQLNRFASERGIPLISTVDAHLENDPEFQAWPAHCVAGTLGQRKPAETVFGQRILEKRNVDCFTEPLLESWLEELRPSRCVVYGVATDICVFHAARGLVQRGFEVEIISEAVRGIDPAKVESMRRQFTFRTMAETTR